MRYFLVIALLACGSTSQVAYPPNVPILPAGNYYVEADYTSTVGECGFLGTHTGGYVAVDDKGAFVNPLKDFSTCTTHYGPFNVTCSGLGGTVTMVGRVFDDDGIWRGAGSGVAFGNVGGCTRATFDWWLVRYDRS